MNNLFDTLFEISDSANSLDSFLNENMQLVNDFYNSNYNNIIRCKNSIERFILLKSNVIAELDFTKSYPKSFILMLLDYCERFNFIAATPKVCSVLTSNNIAINSRLQAALLFLYPKPETNSELVEKFDSICEKLQLAIDIEEDNDKKAIATFLNYYGIVVNDTRLKFAEQIREKLESAIENYTYPFLNNSHIIDAQKIELQDTNFVYTQIQCLIDKLLEKVETVITIPQFEQEQVLPEIDLLIETDTSYSKALVSVLNNFDDIRAISVRNASGTAITNRGVKILESEEELFEYMKRFGNMHKAKLQVAYDLFPKTFPSKVNIIDWGCGQGFASMLFIEQFGSEIINDITLIEPSEIAIKRAALHTRKYNSAIALKTICKKLDDLEATDFTNEQADVTFHLFSNILDIDDYSQSHLIQLLESTMSGNNCFVCVSPYIDDIKADRVDSFARYFAKYETYKLLSEADDQKSNRWYCNDLFNNHKFECDCCNANCWTRIMRVFEINV